MPAQNREPGMSRLLKVNVFHARPGQAGATEVCTGETTPPFAAGARGDPSRRAYNLASFESRQKIDEALGACKQTLQVAREGRKVGLHSTYTDLVDDMLLPGEHTQVNETELDYRMVEFASSDEPSVLRDAVSSGRAIVTSERLLLVSVTAGERFALVDTAYVSPERVGDNKSPGGLFGSLRRRFGAPSRAAKALVGATSVRADSFVANEFHPIPLSSIEGTRLVVQKGHTARAPAVGPEAVHRPTWRAWLAGGGGAPAVCEWWCTSVQLTTVTGTLVRIHFREIAGARRAMQALQRQIHRQSDHL